MIMSDRCRHDMLIGTCAECDAPRSPRPPLPGDELVLCYAPRNPADHRVHEPDCYWATHSQDVDEPWPRRSITRAEAAGMEPCGTCQPSLSKAGATRETRERPPGTKVR
jgi:hypothetical protein